MKSSITVKHSITIKRSKEYVWDFTQNYDYRPKWDQSILKAIILQTVPNRIVKLKMRGNTSMSFVYKIEDRPNKTTLTSKDVQPLLIESAGGSWIYEERENGTQWTQTNTIVFKNNFILSLFLVFFKLMFEKQTIKAMLKAKKMMENPEYS